MNRTTLKNYAPQARRDFIQAMTDRAAYYGLTVNKVSPVVERGDVAIIAGREFPGAVARKRKALEARIQRQGFEATMEALAYTWFNRLVAIRFMELHDYLDHGYRVLSPSPHRREGAVPEILEQAEHVDLPGLSKETVIDLKLAGNQESVLYRLLLTAQCNALHAAMPFLFEKIDDETELLLPDNLLHSDSLIRKLVNAIDEEDWQEVEIIGWLYQFYISEKKDQVIGKVVASADIPAATQLFTPNWIVKYLVQNTLGRQWLATYSQSALRQQMEYYIEPAEQTPEVQEQLKAITPTTLNPEELTLLDPACGSGHILVEAYDLFKAIYTERGYPKREIPRLILEKNLFGLEIDDRAAQLASFALMMKARADDRRIFESGVKPNILAFQESHGLNAADITRALNAPINKDDVPREFLFDEMQEEKDGLFSKRMMAEKGHVSEVVIKALLELFENAKTFGSLIQIPPKLAAKLPEIEKRLDDVLKHGDLTHTSAHVLKPLLQQAQLLTRQYDAVVANPPYMGWKGMNQPVKRYLQDNYSEAKSDLFAAFILHNLNLTVPAGQLGFITPFVWMFISSYEKLRTHILAKATIINLVQLEYNAFEPACVPVCAFTIFNGMCPEFKGDFIALSKFRGHQSQSPRTLEAITNPNCGWRFRASLKDFEKIPGTPIAFAISDKIRSAFIRFKSIGNRAKKGLTTGDNSRFLRLWHEVEKMAIKMSNFGKWVPTTKGGAFRKWYGNHEYIINWESDGFSLKNFFDQNGKLRSVIRNKEYYFQSGITWNDITISAFSARIVPNGFICNAAGPMIYGGNQRLLLGMLNSVVNNLIAGFLAPTFHFEVGTVGLIPVPEPDDVVGDWEPAVNEAVEISKADWDNFETSWDFRDLPTLRPELKAATLEASWRNWEAHCTAAICRMQELETENNRLFIAAYGLEGELQPEVPEEQITLYRSNREEDIKRLLSYAMGCMMGRYSLDQPGLIYAHSGNQGFDSSQYPTFPADDDGIIPLLATDWGFPDDATTRLVEFISVAWPKEHLEENLKFIAGSLGPTGTEQPRDTLRRYFAAGFYKHHLTIYKRRPIYWLFASGKQRAFQCLVYLHRYHDGTLARMRTEYVIPLQGRIAARIDQLEGDQAKAASTSHRKKLQKEQDDLKKQQAELAVFEEKLKHAADQQISLDLDDGVKVNYSKFGDLLAETKAITGGKDDD